MYKLRYMPRARKFFKKIKDKKLIKIFNEALDDIENNPFSGERKTGDLAGIYCKDLYYNKTNCEIAYRIFESNGHYVIIILAGTRENFYEELKKYMI